MAANWPLFLTTCGEPVVFTAAGSSAVTLTALVSFPKFDEVNADTREQVRGTALVRFLSDGVDSVSIDDELEFHGDTWLVRDADLGEGAVWRVTAERRETVRIVGRGRAR